jgi:hypothetical protein
MASLPYEDPIRALLAEIDARPPRRAALRLDRLEQDIYAAMLLEAHAGRLGADLADEDRKCTRCGLPLEWMDFDLCSTCVRLTTMGGVS